VDEDAALEDENQKRIARELEEVLGSLLKLMK
jgi:hypothetical protein